ncbi:S-adenosyl-L-methionine-dependent methyltransferase [Sporormia fimetaria CBS 119925]|uniref:S-adenosyl-L-methionine-dependent methyltransferase n=1 Tax=Sporormia fimetaria CBS 119925 TaxID=1340428 RepID=A0A6A6VJ58_9PLEO|nr:S-adenosyl-L-methionine-dependent methyltransferase [Sporormia fimetaria CBS 119925]
MRQQRRLLSIPTRNPTLLTIKMMSQILLFQILAPRRHPRDTLHHTAWPPSVVDGVGGGPGCYARGFAVGEEGGVGGDVGDDGVDRGRGVGEGSGCGEFLGCGVGLRRELGKEGGGVGEECAGLLDRWCEGPEEGARCGEEGFGCHVGGVWWPRRESLPSMATNTDARFETDNSVSQKAQPRQQLSKAMEHMRFAVTVDPIPHPSPSPAPKDETNGDTTTSPAPESDAYGVPASFAPIRNPSARSHSPTNNQKRTDPFAFGSRLLEEGDDIFEFNAWDHVTVDPSYAEFSEQQYEKQRQDPVSDFDKQRFNSQPEKWWNMFYKNNRANFFKNRKWLAQEFPVLDQITKEDAKPAKVLEVGAGAGNSAFPILAKNKNQGLKIHACDFSKKAVEVIRENEAYDTRFIQADVWDVASSPESENGGLPPGIEEGSVDVVLMIFIFSALSPKQWNQAVRNIWRVLKPGGQVLFRDYGRGDLAQVRFKKGRYMEENFYVRGDGTRVYFFEQEELEEIWGGQKAPQRATNGDASLEQQVGDLALQDEKKSPREEDPIPTPEFEIVHFGVDRRMLVNRQRRLKMYRCWMQAVFRKPSSEEGTSSEVPTSTLRQNKEEEGAEEEKEA